MSYTIENCDGTEAHETMLAAMEASRLFSVEPNADGTFHVMERCDTYFSVDLTAEQLLALADELRALAMAPDPR